MLSEETHSKNEDLRIFNYLEKCRLHSEVYYNQRDNLDKLISKRHKFILKYQTSTLSNEEISLIIKMIKLTDESISKLLSI